MKSPHHFFYKGKDEPLVTLVFWGYDETTICELGDFIRSSN